MKKNHYLYARFRHILSYPAEQRQEGISISKLRVLDTLIDRIVKLRGKDSTPAGLEKVDPSQLDNLIVRLQKELQSSVAGSAAGYGAPVFESGILLNILA